MSQLTIPPASSCSVLPARVPSVWVDGRQRGDLRAAGVELSAGPRFGQATIEPGEPTGQKVRRGRIDQLPPVGSEVVIAWGPGRSNVLLRGVVTAHKVRLGDDAEQVVAEVAHALAGRLGEPITRRFHAGDPSPVEAPDVPVRFNGGPDELASPDAATLNGRSCRLFDASRTARAWSVADALAYLLAAHLPADVQAPSPAELDLLAGAVELERLDVTGLGLYEALSTVAGRAGLRLGATCDARALAFYRPGLDGPVRRVCLQAPGQTLRLDRTNLHRGAIEFSRRPSRPALLLVGGPKCHEATFELQPGWDPQYTPTRWRDTARSLSSDWTTYGDVFRKWVLNEHGWYAGPPWGLAVFDLAAAVSSDDFTVRVPRPLRPCLSTGPGGASLGVVVEVRLGAELPWRRWRGPLWVSAAQAAVYLGGDGLPAEYFEAAMADQAAVRVTATVAADTRLSLRLEGDAAGAVQVVELPMARWARVSESSVLLGRPGLGSPAECDDTPVLQAWLEANAPAAAPACGARLTLGWIDPTFAPGDLIDRVEGRPLELRGRSDLSPHVAAVRHDFDNQLTDLTVQG